MASIAMGNPGTPAMAEDAARRICAAAERALAEAEARRQAAPAAVVVAERDGPAGPDPVRYSDWEVKGIASDF